jgi:predicted HTH transcriptional regulator
MQLSRDRSICPLQVFLVPGKSARELNQNDSLVPPAIFKRLQDKYSGFFSNYRGFHPRLKWIYRANMVTLQITHQERYDIELVIPFKLACVLAYVAEKPNRTIQELSALSRLSKQEITSLISTLSERNLPMLLVSDDIVRFDPEFTTNERRFSFQIERPHINWSAIQASSQVPQKEVYSVIITRFMKHQTRATRQAILNQVKTQLDSIFDERLFAKVLQELQDNQFLAQSPHNPDVLIFIG